MIVFYMRFTFLLFLLVGLGLNAQVNYSIDKPVDDYMEIEIPKDSITKRHIKSVKGILYKKKYGSGKFKKELTACRKEYDTLGNAVFEKLTYFCVDGYCSQSYKHMYEGVKLAKSEVLYWNGEITDRV